MAQNYYSICEHITDAPVLTLIAAESKWWELLDIEHDAVAGRFGQAVISCPAKWDGEGEKMFGSGSSSRFDIQVELTISSEQIRESSFHYA
jgi:hypothetical protein